jgi:hypothetical protein
MKSQKNNLWRFGQIFLAFFFEFFINS